MTRKLPGMTQRVISRLKQGPPKNFITEWRDHRGYYLKDVQDRLLTQFETEITTASLSRIENSIQPCETGLLMQLAVVLRTSPTALMSRGPDDSPGLEEVWARITPDNRKQAMRVLTALAEPESEGTDTTAESKRKRA